MRVYIPELFSLGVFSKLFSGCPHFLYFRLRANCSFPDTFLPISIFKGFHSLSCVPVYYSSRARASIRVEAREIRMIEIVQIFKFIKRVTLNKCRPRQVKVVYILNDKKVIRGPKRL